MEEVKAGNGGGIDTTCGRRDPEWRRTWCERTTTLGPLRRRRRAASLSVRPASSAVHSRRSTSSSSPVSCTHLQFCNKTRHHNHTSRWLDQRPRATEPAEGTHQVRHGHIIRRRHVRAALVPSVPAPPSVSVTRHDGEAEQTGQPTKQLEVQ